VANVPVVVVVVVDAAVAVQAAGHTDSSVAEFGYQQLLELGRLEGVLLQAQLLQRPMPPLLPKTSRRRLRCRTPPTTNRRHPAESIPCYFPTWSTVILYTL